MQIDRPIVIALIIIAIILLVIFLVMPEYRTFGELRTEFAEKRAEYNAEFDYYNAIANTYNDLQSRKDDLKKIDDALPIESNIGNIFYSLQKIAKESGIIVRSMFLSKSSGAASDGVKDMVFSVSAAGDYKSLQRFIISLERSSRIFEVPNISFGSASAPQLESSQSQFQMQQIYSFNLQIKTHSY